MKHKHILVLTFLCLLVGVYFTQNISWADTTLADIPTWCQTEIQDMVSSKIINGYNDGHFYPNRSITRIQMAKILHNVCIPEIIADETSELAVTVENTNPGYWGNPYIVDCLLIGIDYYGYTKNEWNKAITRLEMTHMIAGYYYNMVGDDFDFQFDKGIPNYIADYSTFAQDDRSNWVLWAYSIGLINGSDKNGTFHPNNTLTRAEACVILYRIKNETSRVSVYKMALEGGDYKPGSVYGPKLNQKELNDVKSIVSQFVNGAIRKDMSDYDKLFLAQDFLSATCEYAESWAKNNANTAWGALVYHEAQCSGYARAMKALCDGMQIPCYYVHANDSSLYTEHQFVIAQCDGDWYIIDAQLNDASGFGAAFLISENAYTAMTGITWDHSGLPDCSKSFCVA